MLASHADGHPGIRLCDPRGKARLEGFVSGDGSPHFVLWDETTLRSVFAVPEGQVDLRREAVPKP